MTSPITFHSLTTSRGICLRGIHSIFFYSSSFVFALCFSDFLIFIYGSGKKKKYMYIRTIQSSTSSSSLNSIAWNDDDTYELFIYGIHSHDDTIPPTHSEFHVFRYQSKVSSTYCFT